MIVADLLSMLRAETFTVNAEGKEVTIGQWPTPIPYLTNTLQPEQ